ncbi:7910_t:CDS:2, partial [Scutellospora calospora]
SLLEFTSVSVKSILHGFKMFVSLALITAALAVVSAAPGRNRHESHSHQKIAEDDFVQVDGLRFKDAAGSVYLTGLNYWSCLNLAADESAGGNHSRLILELDDMASKGVNHLRIMAASEGAPTWQPFHVEARHAGDHDAEQRMAMVWRFRSVRVVGATTPSKA